MQLYILIFALTVNNISTLCMNYELQPIYTTKENIRTHKPTKPTLSLQQLAETTINFRAAQYKNEALINLIQNIKAVENSIPIDTIATYIYNNPPMLTRHLHHHQAIIRLYCLKQYLTTAKKNNETIPSQVTDIMHHKKLFERLNLTNEIDTNKHLSYQALLINLTKIIHEPEENISEFIDYIYKNKDITPQNTPIKSNQDCIYKIYELAYNYLFMHNNDKRTALELVETANNTLLLQPSTDTKALAQTIINLKVSPLFIAWLSLEKENFLTLLTRKRIALIWPFITKYNQKRGDKKTPTASQYYCYHLKNDLNLSKPDWDNESMINNKIYALEESKDLIENLYCLSNASEETIEQAFKGLYPQEIK